MPLLKVSISKQQKDPLKLVLQQKPAIFYQNNPSLVKERKLMVGNVMLLVHTSRAEHSPWHSRVWTQQGQAAPHGRQGAIPLMAWQTGPQ